MRYYILEISETKSIKVEYMTEKIDKNSEFFYSNELETDERI